jgi:molecular chaperone GrpE
VPSFFNDKDKKRDKIHAAEPVVAGEPASPILPEEDDPAAVDRPSLVPDPPSFASGDQIEKLMAANQELTNTLLRRQADFDNYRKRVEKERQQERHRGVESVIEQILPVLDAINNALDGAQGAAAGADYQKGFELVRRQLWDVLSKQGLTRIESVGKEFNPHFHHAIERLETSDHPDGTVVGELLPGYIFQERVLRPAMVRVSIEPPGKTSRGAKHDN